MYIKTDNKEVGAKLAAYYQAGKPIEIMGKSFLGTSIGFEYPDSCVEFHGSEVSKVAWTGEGLPPVGTVCEVRNSGLHNPVWEKCTILFCGKRRMLYDSESCSERCGYIEDLEFRPIRTPEQIAEEEREKSANEMSNATQGAKDWMEAFRKLYDAGYRKV